MRERIRAAVLPAVGAPFRVEEIRFPRPKKGEVLVKVTACGVCHSDLHVAKGDLKFPLPCVPGHEISGIVEELGPEVSGLRVGEKVVCSFIMPCGWCDACRRGRDDLCETYFAINRVKGALYDGETRLFRPDGTPLAMNMMGGMAEYAVVPATDVFPLAGNLPLAESCILGCALMTAYGALKHQAELRAGETVAIVGIGGVGSNVIQLARHFGAAEIIAVDVKDEKLDAARKIGATQTVNASKGDPVEQVASITGGRGVNVAIEALGRPETVSNAFKMAGEGGRVVVIGVAAGQAAAPIEITRLVRRGIRVTGSYGCRVRTDMPELIRLAADGKIDVARSISRRYPLGEVETAFRALDRGEIIGRAIVVMEGKEG